MREFEITASPALLEVGLTMCVGESITVKGTARGSDLLSIVGHHNAWNKSSIRKILGSNPKRRTYDLVDGPYQYLVCVFNTTLTVQTVRGRCTRKFLYGTVYEVLPFGAHYLIYNHKSRDKLKLEMISKVQLDGYVKRLR
jgi:hypothetical protein